MISSWIGVDCKSSGESSGEKRRQRDMERGGRGGVKMGVRWGWLGPPSQGAPRVAHHQNLGEGLGAGSPSAALEGSSSAGALIVGC